MTASGDTKVDRLFHLEVSSQAPGDWDRLLARDKSAEYTHTRYWIDALCEHVPAAEPLWLSLRRSGELVGGINAVKRKTSRKILGLELGSQRLDSSFEGTSGGPVIAADLGEADRELIFCRLIDALADQSVGLLGSCAMVLGPDMEQRFGAAMLARPQWERSDAATALVSLAGGIDEVGNNRLVRTKRNERNRGLRRGAEVLATREAGLLDEYYGIYLKATRHWGVDPAPLPLLQALLADPGGGVFFTCVRLDGQVIGGHLNLHFGNRILAWNGVTDPDFARSHFPATLCFWGDMMEACRREADWLDLGGSGGVDSLTGFKRYFGAELHMRGLYILDSPWVHLLRKGRQGLTSLRGHRPVERLHDAVPTKGSGEQS